MLLSPGERAFRPVPRPTFDQTRRRRYCVLMPRRTSQSGKKPSGRKRSRVGAPHAAGESSVPSTAASDVQQAPAPASRTRPSALVDTRVIYCGDRAEPRPSGSGPHLALEDRHASTAAYIDHMRPCCVELARVLKKREGVFTANPTRTRCVAGRQTAAPGEGSRGRIRGRSSFLAPEIHNQ